MRIASPLATWFPTDAALARFRRRDLGRRAAVLAPRDDRWRALAPGFDRIVDLAARGLPFQIAAERRHDRAPDPARLREALATGASVFLPQAHQVLPRVARVMVALRNALLGPFREATSYLFCVEGRGREGMGLHHDGDVDAFWLQLEGRRMVTIGRPVAANAPEDLDDALLKGRRGWRTFALPPGSLLHLPPRTPHRVVYHERSLALTFTWGRARARRARASSATRLRAARISAATSGARLRALADWDVTGGRAEPWPPERASGRLWTQVPALVAKRSRDHVTLLTPAGEARVSAAAGRLVGQLATMPELELDDHVAPWLAELIAFGILGDENLPELVIPDDPTTLDGWKFS